jgi:hypothetical protein
MTSQNKTHNKHSKQAEESRANSLLVSEGAVYASNIGLPLVVEGALRGDPVEDWSS